MTTTNETAPDVRDLFDRWERVWNDGEYALIADCLQPNYIRHDEVGDRTVTRAAYAAEIAAARRERPGNRFIVYDHEIIGDRAWFRFTLQWRDARTGEPRTRAGLQLYRIEDGRLAETWLTQLKLGSAWPDPIAQEHWTTRRAELQRQAGNGQG